MPHRCVPLGVLAAALVVFASLGSAGRSLPQNATTVAASIRDWRAGTVLVFPFENASHEAGLDWLGEGLSELTVERLEGRGPHLLSRQERLDVLERMGLPAGAPLSLATMFKVAQQADADQVIVGRYVSDGNTLTVSARVLRLGALSLSPEFAQSGAATDVLALQARLAPQLLCALQTEPANAPACGNAAQGESFSAQPILAQPSAFELYIRGLMGLSDEMGVLNLREAARQAPSWPAPAVALGEIYFARRDCESALPWLSRVPPAWPEGIEAGFIAGVCHLLRNDPMRAEAAFSALVNRPAGLPAAPGLLPEARNNLAIALAREGKTPEALDVLGRTTKLDAGDPDYWFNLGLVELQAKQLDSAVAAFRNTLRLQPADTRARAFLAAALDGSGRSQEAGVERVLLTGASARLMLPKNPDPAYFAPFGRIRMRLDRVSLRSAATGPNARAIEADAASASGPPPVHAESAGAARGTQRLSLHLDRGQQFLSSDDLDDAQRAFVEALLLAPQDATAHAGLAEVYRRQRRPDDAVREARAALGSRDDVATRVSLARLLLEDNRPAEARAELGRILALDPQNVAARELLDQLQSRTASGESR
jgi:tetratricopeptide (TPR) repeat protein